METSKSSPQEKTPKQILEREDILEAIEQYLKGYTIERELSGEKGIYLLEARVAGEKPGEVIEYRYQRKGSFGRNQSLQTVVQVTYYEDDIPVGGTTVVNYDENTGKWEHC